MVTQRLRTPRTLIISALALTVAGFGVPLGIAAQAPTVLGKPEIEFPTPFTQVASIRELRDGRVLVADSRDNILQLIDLRLGRATAVGRPGAGPSEYGMLSRIIPLVADTSLIYDPRNTRYFLIEPAGRIGKVFRPEETMPGGGRGLGGGAVARGSDSRGRLYYEGSPFATAPGGGMAPADTVPVIRYDLRTKRSDTLAYVRLAQGNAQVTVKDDNLRLTVGAKPFPARDDWVPLASGGIVVVRVADYHVDIYGPSGGRTSGAPVEVDAIAVTEADKEEWRAFRESLKGLTVGRGGAPSTGSPLGAGRPEPVFPAVKPAFVVGDVFARANGEVWVLRSRKWSDKIPVYDVFNSTGTLARRVALPVKTRLVGFGSGTAYVVRSDADDLQYLQRYKIP